MRHTPLFLAMTVAAVALTACDNPTTAPTRTAGLAPSAQVLTNETSRGPVSGFNSCNGDVLSGTAQEHFVFAVTADGAGGTHGTVKLQLSNVKATGSPSGASYVGNVTVSEAFNFTAGGAQTQTFNETQSTIGQGQTPNEIIHFLLHVTVNANGDVTALVDNFSIQCH